MHQVVFAVANFCICDRLEDEKKMYLVLSIEERTLKQSLCYCVLRCTPMILSHSRVKSNR